VGETGTHKEPVKR